MLQPLTSLVNRVVWEGSPTRVRNVPGDLEPIVGSSKKAPETKRTDNHAPDGKGGGCAALLGKGQISTSLLSHFRLRQGGGVVVDAHIEIDEFPKEL